MQSWRKCWIPVILNSLLEGLNTKINLLVEHVHWKLWFLWREQTSFVVWAMWRESKAMAAGFAATRTALVGGYFCNLKSSGGRIHFPINCVPSFWSPHDSFGTWSGNVELEYVTALTCIWSFIWRGSLSFVLSLSLVRGKVSDAQFLHFTFQGVALHYLNH